ncbi:DUF202 domain-containing protein [Sphingomonas cavernae]|uniref:DUF202 domain-containing protein n=1 Tax=Sphingomonas cavernae TaxID=2320861 RepID=A0A418WM88_9SPHN|nr:DUF202 domain-containing protein [Sphingomonas cavernae]RJF91111.1 DUF202 domain-containing protein [Sphingomonas cavernae]
MTDTPRPGMGDEELADDQLVNDSASTELASNRTALALVRTEAASDRTLMAVLRTSLSLISFGFTIFQFFNMLKKNQLADAVGDAAPRRFGITLIVLGLVLLCLGIYNHLKTVKTLRQRRNWLFRQGLLRHLAQFHISSITAIAVALFIVGLLAIGSILFRLGPY